jgi:hypothetical protein
LVRFELQNDKGEVWKTVDLNKGDTLFIADSKGTPVCRIVMASDEEPDGLPR